MICRAVNSDKLKFKIGLFVEERNTDEEVPLVNSTYF